MCLRKNFIQILNRVILNLTSIKKSYNFHIPYGIMTLFYLISYKYIRLPSVPYVKLKNKPHAVALSRGVNKKLMRCY
jgi:hypothetical protein